MTSQRVRVIREVGRRGVPATRSFATWVEAALGRGHRTRPVVIVLLAPARARALNRRFRGRNYATNVLSFAYEPLPGEAGAPLGELVLCPAVIAREAREQGKPLRHHYAHLTVHGVLHLLGHDHRTAAQARVMEGLEVRILARFGIPDPYR
jgi:probable rRNA maturation factor